MKKYAIGVLSFFQNENKVFIVKAKNDNEAMRKALSRFKEEDMDDYVKEWIENMKNNTLEEIQGLCFDGDIAISLPIEIE